MSKPKPTSIKLIAGSAHPELSEAIAKLLKVEISSTTMTKFANGETRVEVFDSLRGSDCYIIQPICEVSDEDGQVVQRLNDLWMELLITVSALKGASAARITAIMPFVPYMRADKKDKSRASITASLCGRLLQTAGVDRSVGVELHASQIQGFYKSMDHQWADLLLLHAIQEMVQDEAEHYVVVAPHASGTQRATRVADSLKSDCAIISKQNRSSQSAQADAMLVGDVKGKIVLLVDDLLDTCDVVLSATRVLMAKGAKCVHIFAIHGTFSGSAIDRLNACDDIKSATVTNSVSQTTNQLRCPKIKVADLSPYLAAVVKNLHEEKSLEGLSLDLDQYL